MRLLLDTNILIYWLEGKLAEASAKTIEIADEIFVSAISAVEFGLKPVLARTLKGVSLETCVAEGGFKALPLTFRHVKAANELPPIHKDPFDRLLLGQTFVEGMTIMSTDKIFKKYPVPLIFAKITGK